VGTARRQRVRAGGTVAGNAFGPRGDDPGACVTDYERPIGVSIADDHAALLEQAMCLFGDGR
jgi:hypothetical protein